PAGNRSGRSDIALVDTPAVFSDGFESGDLSAWTSSTGMTVGTAERYSGARGGRATSTGSAAYAYFKLPVSRPEVFVRERFKVLSHGATSVNLLRFRTSGGTALATVSTSSADKLALRNDVSATTTTSTTTVSTGKWHEVQVRLLAAGAASRAQVYLDGTP